MVTGGRLPLLLGLAAGAVVVGGIGYLAGATRGAQPSRATAPSVSAAVTTEAAARAPEREVAIATPDPNAPRSPRTPARAPSAAAPPNEALGGVAVPLPPMLGGGKPVSPATREVATRLGLVPEELTDLAKPPGGALPKDVVKRLDDAYARGLSLGDRLGLGPPDDELVANRFANQLVRLSREMQRSSSSPPGDVVDAVTRDTLADLRRNLGDAVADAAKPELSALPPLR